MRNSMWMTEPLASRDTSTADFKFLNMLRPQDNETKLKFGT